MWTLTGPAKRVDTTARGWTTVHCSLFTVHCSLFSREGGGVCLADVDLKRTCQEGRHHSSRLYHCSEFTQRRRPSTLAHPSRDTRARPLRRDGVAWSFRGVIQRIACPVRLRHLGCRNALRLPLPDARPPARPPRPFLKRPTVRPPCRRARVARVERLQRVRLVSLRIPARSVVLGLMLMVEIVFSAPTTLFCIHNVVKAGTWELTRRLPSGHDRWRL